MLDRDKRLAKMRSEASPLTINWDRELILDFLKRQYEAGAQEAEDLLYLQLHNDMRVKLTKAKNCQSSTKSKDEIEAEIKSFTEYPKSVTAALLDDYLNGKIDFDAPYFTDQVCDSDDIPF